LSSLFNPPPWNKKPAQRLKLEPFRERAASRYGEVAAFHLGDTLFTQAMPWLA
jgi:hypothetical protein